MSGQYVYQFPPSNISLKNVCNVYGVSNSLNSMRGQTYYTDTGNLGIINNYGPINLGQLRNCYSKALEETLSGDTGTRRNQTYGIWPYAGITCRSYFQATYKYVPGMLVNFTFSCNAESGNVGASRNDRIQAFGAYWAIDGGSESNDIGRGNTITIGPIRSKLQIRIATYAQNDSSGSQDANNTWIYYVQPSGTLLA